MEGSRILWEFGKDDVYKLFLIDEFDVKAITSSAVQLVAVSEHLAKLSSGVILLDKELHHQVANHYDHLFSQATEIETLETDLQMVNGRIETLLLSADRLRRNVVDPYETVSSQTVMLVRLQMTCDLLRRIIRIRQLCHRLTVQLRNNEITKAAQCINELNYLMENIDLSGIHVIENQLQLIKTGREQIYSEANVLLLKGMEMQTHMNVATALQVFQHLHVLKESIQKILQQTENKICQNIKEALDVQLLSCQKQDAIAKAAYGPGRAAIPLTGNTVAFRLKLWTNMDGLLSNILSALSKVQHLQNVLFKIRDSSTNTRLLDELDIDTESDLVQSLWNVIMRTLTDEFANASKESTYIKQAFEVEFPKLLCMFNDFSKTFNERGCSIRKTIPGTNDSIDETNSSESSWDRNGQESLRFALSPFESAYLSRCLSRLIDSVNVAYADEDQAGPTVKDVEGIATAIKSELTAAAVDPLLLKNVARNVADTIAFFIEKCKSLVSIEKEAFQVIDQPNTKQLMNAHVVHLLHLLQEHLYKVLRDGAFSEDASFQIQSSLQAANSLIRNIVQPHFHSIISAVSEIMMTMHKEDFSLHVIDEKGRRMPEPLCSLFMKELQKFITRSRNDYLSLYPNCTAKTKGTQDLLIHLAEMFVKHVSLIRPIGDGGKMKLAADCAQMEMIITSWCHKIGDLGKSYRLLRSFKPLLFQTASHISQSSTIGDIVPYSIVLHFLYSKAPSELKSPHEVAGWSLEEYSIWLEKHVSEKERLTLIKASLEKYVSSVKQRGEKEFCSVYPIMLDLLQRGLQETT